MDAERGPAGRQRGKGGFKPTYSAKTASRTCAGVRRGLREGVEQVNPTQSDPDRTLAREGQIWTKRLE